VYRDQLLWSCASTARHERIFPGIQPSPDQQAWTMTGNQSRHHQSGITAPISWEDHVTQVCEESGVDPLQYRRTLRLQQWYKYVRDYQGRKLTYPSDTFPAISAVASNMALHLGFTYCAGIWIEDAAQGLAWRTYGFGHSQPPWRAPSWSWASIKSLVRRPDYPDIYETTSWSFRHDQYSLRVHTIPFNCGIRHFLTPCTALDVVGQILPFHLWADNGVISNDGPHKPNYGGLHGFVTKNDRLQCEFDRKLKGREYCSDDLRSVVLLRLGTWIRKLLPTRYDRPGKTPEFERFGYALMLTTEDELYSRVGIARIPDTDDWWDKGWQWARLDLI
jgi:hypothetical protein